MPIRRLTLRLSALMLPVAGLACNGDDVSQPTGSLQVTSATSGTGTDADGYTVRLDGRGVGTIGATSSTVIADLPPGEHQVDLAGVAENCQVEGEMPQAVTIPEAAAATVAFSVVCGELVPPTDGEVVVTVATRGSSVDRDGYGIVLYDMVGPAVPANGSVTVSGLVTGEQAVALTGVAPNCAVQGEHPVRLTLESGVPAAVSFSVVCRTPIAAPWPIVRRATHDLTHVSGTSSSNVFAIGHAPPPCETCQGDLSIIHFDGDDWSTQLTATGSSLDIWAGPSGVAFALVGGSFSSPFLRWNGGSWSTVTAEQIELNGGGLFALWGSSSTDVHAVGGVPDASSTRLPYAAHFDLLGWRPEELPPTAGLTLTDIWGSSQTDVYAAGTVASPDGSDDRGVVLHFDGVEWITVLEEPHVGFSRVWGSGVTDVWVTGHAKVPTGEGRTEVDGHGVVRHYDGTSWSTVQAPTSAALGAVWAGSPGDVYAIADGGQSGSVWRYDGAGWIELELGGGGLNDIWGSPTGDVFAVAKGGVILRGP